MTTPSMTTIPSPAPIRANRNFRLLWAGEAVSVLGSTTTSIVFPLIAVTQFHAGPTAMGLLAGAIWLPWLLIGLVAGAWVDRADPRRVMMRADVVSAVGVASIPVAWALGVLTLAHVIASALLLGFANVFFRTGYTTFVPRVVGRDDLEQANARIYGTESAMQVAGPGVGGVLVQVVGAAYAVVLDVLTFAVSWVCLARMRTEELLAPPERPERRALRAEVADGIRIVSRDRFLRFFMLQGALGNFAITGYAALLVLFLVRDLAMEPSQVGLLMGLGFSGGLVGAALAQRTSRWLGDAGALRWLQVLGGPPALLIGLAFPGAGIALVPLGMFLVGAGVVGANVVRAAFRARYTPAEVMGRTSSTMAVLNFGTMPLAGVVAGALGGIVGVRETILLMGALNALACLSVFVGPYRSGRDLPAQPMEMWTSGSMATARKSNVT